jgi:hypothetical protein
MAKKPKGKNKPYFLGKKKQELKTKSLSDLQRGFPYWVTGFFYNKISDTFEIVEPFQAVYPSHAQGEIDISKMEVVNGDIQSIDFYKSRSLLKGDSPRKVSMFIERVDAIRFLNGLEAHLKANPNVRYKVGV